MDEPFRQISGGVTAPKGFRAAAVACGIRDRATGRDDLGLIASEVPAVAAATFTTNRIKAAPVRVSMAHLRSAEVRGVVVNSGNANACTGAAGILAAKRTAAAVSRALGWRDRQVLVCSTGRIGRPLPIDDVERAVPGLVDRLRADGEGGSAVARAIMTSDTFAKEVAVELTVGGKPVRIGGTAKGAGMINPDMATMLCFVTTDAALPKRDLQRLFSGSVEQSFNRITVDGDMSTNDTAILLANGAAGAELTDAGAVAAFAEGLGFVTRRLARMIVEDGEGATKFVEVHVKNAATYQDARKVAEAVANSVLVKCSWCGEDPNWGRVMDAIGYANARVREEMIDVFYDGVIAAEHGLASGTPPEKLAGILRNKNFTVTIDLHLGTAEYKVFTTDLTPEYVRLNLGE